MSRIWWVVGNVLLSFLSCLMLSVRPLRAAENGGETVQPLPASAEDVRPLLVGTEAPDAALKTMEGRPFALKTAVSERPAVLVFYRGWW